MPPGRKPEPPEERFWKYIEKCDDGCWRWRGSKINTGYGLIYINGKTVYTHRFSYGLHHPITTPMSENDLLILHNCNNPACCNPAHLRLGTQQENMDDRTKQRRETRGEEHYNAKLTEKQVLEIRARYAAGGTSHQELADQYGVSETTIYYVNNRKSWLHI